MAKRPYVPGTGALVGFRLAQPGFMSGEDTPRAFLDRCIRVIKQREDRVQAFARLDLKHARREADAATERYARGQPLSDLDGCPVGIKDIIHTRRMVTAMGSAIYDGFHAPCDAACVAALRAAGAIVVGKTHTTEFAVGESPPTTNPWRRSRTPGGSSSGSAAAVGAGMLPLALGTQTMGSILRPASYCGAVGFKPSIGAIPMAGVHPLSRTLDHVGPIAASVDDAWAAAMVMQSAFGGEAVLGSAWFDPARPARPQTLARLDHLLGVDERDPGVQPAFDAWVDAVSARGVEIVSIEAGSELARMLGQANAVCLDIMRYEFRYPLGVYQARDRESLGPRIRDHLAQARAIDVGRYRARLAEREKLRDAVAALAVDGFVMPAAGGPAPKGLTFTGARTMLAPWSLIGGPAWSLPLLQVGGLPMGVQLAGAPGHDSPLAGIAHWLMSIEGPQ